MLWHVARRELAGSVMTLRFPIAALLVLSLFVVNGIVFVGADYRSRMEDYTRGTRRSLERLEGRASDLTELAIGGPGSLQKRPSPLGFVCMGHDALLPTEVHGSSRGGYGWGKKGFRYNWSDPWTLSYPPRSEGRDTLLHAFLELDWAFVIGVVVSFVCVLFTYDAVSGEREDGTLRLSLSYAVPRDVLLLGKWLGAFLSVAVPTAIGLLLNLLTVQLSGQVILTGASWARLALAVGLSFVYIGLFVSLGLFVSARFRRSDTSLLALLFVWVLLVILMPNTLGTIASGLTEIPSSEAFGRERTLALQERSKPDGLYDASPSEVPPKPEALRRWASYLNSGVDIYTRLTDGHLDEQFRQIAITRTLMRISPASIYQYVMESVAATGFERHRDFVAGTRRYRRQFVDFVKEADRRDPDSPHVYLVKEGISSAPVGPGAVPRFRDSVSLRTSLDQATMDILILLSLGVLFFALSYVSFLKYDPR